MCKKISKYMIYNELKIYINDLTLSRATKVENELVSRLYYYREKL